jgi:hypothetical protein
MSATPNSSATMSSSGTPPSAPPSGASRDANSTTVRQNSSVATTATPPVRVPPPTVPAASSPNFDAHRNPVPNANNSSPTLSASNAAPSAPLNSAVSASMAPSAAPKLAPVSVQPPLHGVMTIARSTDQQFILKLPAEALPGGPATSLRMQRFVMVPQQGRWHHHRAIAKLTVGELLSHTAPDKPDAKIQPRAGDTVTVRAFVDKNGAVRELKPVSGRFALMPHVMRTVRDWQFDQTLVDGKPVESEVNITVEYRGAN